MDSLFNSPLLETILTLILIYALMSLLVSTITEAINSYFKERGKLLYNTISDLFDDKLNVNFGQLLYNHPMIDKIKKDKNSFPTYISAEMFSNALIDVVANFGRTYTYDAERERIVMERETADIFNRFIKGVDKMYHTELKLLLMNAIDKCIREGENSLEALDNHLREWYNDHMERTTGWYKDKIRNRLFWVALFVSLALNVDSIHLFQTLYKSPALRSQLTPIAESLAANYAQLKPDTTLTDLQKAYKAAVIKNLPRDSVKIDSVNQVLGQVIGKLQQIDSLTKSSDTTRQALFTRAQGQLDTILALGLPIGWSTDAPPLSWRKKTVYSNNYFEQYKNGTFTNILLYILGILISALSFSTGAPFWFQVLVKLVNIRRAGIKPSGDND